MFHSLKDVPHTPPPTTYGILQNCCFSPAGSKLIQDRDQLTKTQCSAVFSPRRLTEGPSRIWHLPAPTRIAMRAVIKHVIVYQLARLVMRKILVAPSPTWKCHQHGLGIAEIVMPPTPVYERPNRPSAARKPCSVCKNSICTRYVDLAYHCMDPSCKNVCHLAATCSGFVNPRGNARPRALSNRVWNCHLHYSQSATSHPLLSPDTSPPCPTPPSLKSLLN